MKTADRRERQCSVFKRLVDNSGFGWEEGKKIPTAPPEVWDVYIQHHPEAVKHRTKTLAFYEELCEIFYGKCATGQFATSFSLNDPATPALTLSSLSRVSNLKRSNMS